MQSTEASDVGKTKVESRSNFVDLIGSISPLTYAIALTAIVAATLFVVADTIRTFEDLQLRNAVMARLSSAQPLLARQFTTHSLDPVIGETDPAGAAIGIVQ